MTGLGSPGSPRRPTSGRASKSAAAFRTISEVAGELDVAQHVLRFWESKFPQVRPIKRGGGRRYYRPEDVDLLRQIRALLYEEGYTIKGAQRLLKGQRRGADGDANGADHLAEHEGEETAEVGAPKAPEPAVDGAAGVLDPTGTGAAIDTTARARLKKIQSDLVDLRDNLLQLIG